MSNNTFVQGKSVTQYKNEEDRVTVELWFRLK